MKTFFAHRCVHPETGCSNATAARQSAQLQASARLHSRAQTSTSSWHPNQGLAEAGRHDLSGRNSLAARWQRGRYWYLPSTTCHLDMLQLAGCHPVSCMGFAAATAQAKLPLGPPGMRILYIRLMSPEHMHPSGTCKHVAGKLTFWQELPEKQQNQSMSLAAGRSTCLATTSFSASSIECWLS